MDRLAGIVRCLREEILTEWETAARELNPAAHVDRPTLRDHIPRVLDSIADAAAALGHDGAWVPSSDTAAHHGLERLEEGFEPAAVVAELSLLRECTLRIWKRKQLAPATVDELRVLNGAIDRAISASIEQYSRARDRTLETLDRISTAALEARTLDEVLQRVLAAFVAASPAVDAASILLVEGEDLRVRAAAGVGADAMRGVVVRVGEGFARQIAAERTARDATSTDPLVRVESELAARAGLRTLFGVPLVIEDEVIGVAQMGSLSAAVFSEQDRQVFSSMAARATVGIQQRLLRDEIDCRAREVERARAGAEHALALVDALLASSSIGVAFVDRELRYQRIDGALAAINGRAPEDHIGRTVAEVLPGGAAVLEPVLRRILETGEPVVDLELEVAPLSTFDEPRWFLANFFPVRTGDGFTAGIGGVILEITERKRAEERLRALALERDAERARLEAVLDQMPAGVLIVDASGAFVLHSRKVEDIWRRKPVDARSMEDYAEWKGFCPETGRALAPDDWAIARALAKGEVVLDDEVEILRGDGTRGIIRNNAAPILDRDGQIVGAVAAFYDTTAQKAAERERARLLDEVTRAEHMQRFVSEASKELAESIEYEATLAKLARLAVPVFADWCLVYVVADGATRLVSVAHVDPAKQQLVDDLARRYPPPPDGTFGLPHVLRTGRAELVGEISDAALVATAQDPEHLRALRALGLVSYIVVPMVSRGHVHGAIVLATADSGRRYDATDLAFATELAYRAAVAVDNAWLYTQAQSAILAREDILAVVSHDLRNPLSSISMGAALLLDSEAFREPRTHKVLQTIQRSAGRMNLLIGDLLDMAGVESGHLSVEPLPVDAANLVAEALEPLAPVAREKGIELRNDAHVEGVRVSCDRRRMTQVFGNLVGNAVKFCRPGEHIVVEGHVVDGHVDFAVSDSGPGITADELPHIFDRYWSAKRHETQGTGLGLYISKGIVDAHGGRIWADSKPGVGSTFHVLLPLAGA